MRDAMRVLPAGGTGARVALGELASGAKLHQAGWLAAGRGWRLAARIAELRLCGWRVQADRCIETEAGGRAAIYSLTAEEQRTARDMIDAQAEAMARSVALAGGAA
jgi:hypothetical protein